jgi:hypothetical protein
LKLWKEALTLSNVYAPRLNLSKEEHLQNISFLIAAMVAFRNAKLKGERAHTWEHGQYGPLQKKLHIPRIYCPVAKYFDQVAKYPDAVYNVRCCPLYDYYLLLCRDTPGYQWDMELRLKDQTRVIILSPTKDITPWLLSERQ